MDRYALESRADQFHARSGGHGRLSLGKPAFGARGRRTQDRGTGTVAVHLSHQRAVGAGVGGPFRAGGRGVGSGHALKRERAAAVHALGTERALRAAPLGVGRARSRAVRVRIPADRQMGARRQRGVGCAGVSESARIAPGQDGDKSSATRNSGPSLVRTGRKRRDRLGGAMGAASQGGCGGIVRSDPSHGASGDRQKPAQG